MEVLGNVSLWIHIAAGIITLIAGPIALFYNKNNEKHKMAGKIFFYAMVIVVITSVTGFIKRPNVVFFQFLLGLSFLVGYHIVRGIRAIRFMKGSLSPTNFDKGWGLMSVTCGLIMLGAGAFYYTKDVNIAFVILFSVFGLASMLDGRFYLRLLNVPKLDKRFWFQLHLNSMFAAFIASTTAFAVNAADFAPWYIQWFAPTVILTPLQIYLMRLRKVSKKDLGSPFADREVAVLQY